MDIVVCFWLKPHHLLRLNPVRVGDVASVVMGNHILKNRLHRFEVSGAAVTCRRSLSRCRVFCCKQNLHRLSTDALGERLMVAPFLFRSRKMGFLQVKKFQPTYLEHPAPC